MAAFKAGEVDVVDHSEQGHVAVLEAGYDTQAAGFGVVLFYFQVGSGNHNGKKLKTPVRIRMRTPGMGLVKNGIEGKHEAQHDYNHRKGEKDVS